MPLAKDIAGFMVEKKILQNIKNCLSLPLRTVEDLNILLKTQIPMVEKEIDLQGQKYLDIEWDRERLAICMWHYGVYAGIYGTWEDTPEGHKRVYREQADRIIASKDIAKIVCVEGK